jgi:hypothetical protein
MLALTGMLDAAVRALRILKAVGTRSDADPGGPLVRGVAVGEHLCYLFTGL